MSKCVLAQVRIRMEIGKMKMRSKMRADAALNCPLEIGPEEPGRRAEEPPEPEGENRQDSMSDHKPQRPWLE